MRTAPGQEVLFSTFTVREVRLRGLLATGRTGQAVNLAESFAAGEGPPTPQWRVIERITTADMLARAGDEHTAAGMLSAAIGDAEILRLPHQLQRIIRLTRAPRCPRRASSSRAGPGGTHPPGQAARSAGFRGRLGDDPERDAAAAGERRR